MANKTKDTDFTYKPAAKRRQSQIFFDPHSYSAFPHVIQLEGDELLLAFRQAPKQDVVRHTHPRSLITLIRSYDNGQSWDIENPFLKTILTDQPAPPIWGSRNLTASPDRWLSMLSVGDSHDYLSRSLQPGPPVLVRAKVSWEHILPCVPLHRITRVFVSETFLKNLTGVSVELIRVSVHILIDTGHLRGKSVCFQSIRTKPRREVHVGKLIEQRIRTSFSAAF